MQTIATEIDMTPIEAEDYELPSYREIGKIVVEVLGKVDTSYHPGWAWEIDRYSYDGSAFWINEGMGIDYFINDYIGDDIPGPGIWTIEHIHGEYIKGDWGFTDDDEDWYWGDIRPATLEEIDEL